MGLGAASATTSLHGHASVDEDTYDDEEHDRADNDGNNGTSVSIIIFIQVVLDVGDSVDLDFFDNLLFRVYDLSVAGLSTFGRKVINTVDGVKDSADLELAGNPLVATEKALLVDADLVSLLSTMDQLLL